MSPRGSHEIRLSYTGILPQKKNPIYKSDQDIKMSMSVANVKDNQLQGSP